MNLDNVLSPVRQVVFRTWRLLGVVVPGRRIEAFGKGPSQIGAVLVINLDRQQQRWRRVTCELRRIRTSDGVSLMMLTRRLGAVDARDGLAVAATVDVDVIYRIADQLHVQPDARLAECFAADEPVRMTRQEVAVARSHIEAWKAIANGSKDYVLVLEDDAWFKLGAGAAIDRGWRAALERCRTEGGPRLLYLSYTDAGGTAIRADVCEDIFRPVRGLWCLSGYVLSREGAELLLRALPVVGPVDLWMNYRFSELHALALTSPAIAQRQDGKSDNAYSIMPYLARAGIVDAGHAEMAPDPLDVESVLAWTARGDHEGLAMALSMLGLRVRVFDGDEQPVNARDLASALQTFDVLIDAPLTSAAGSAAVRGRSLLFLERGARTPPGLAPHQLPRSRATIRAPSGPDGWSWESLCSVLGLAKPVAPFPSGAPRNWRLFRDDRPPFDQPRPTRRRTHSSSLDDSPWVLPPSSDWRPSPPPVGFVSIERSPAVRATMTEQSASFATLVETFPGNLATFARDGLEQDERGTILTIDAVTNGHRPYRSAAFASTESFCHGRFAAEIKAAPGAGLITGFFLHRDAPRQEIDIEFSGAQPTRLLTNVFFNPGDDSTAMGFGYRGTPSWVELGFDTTEDFHLYAIEWQPDRVSWLVDGTVVHERVSWDPTPVPHLSMRLHANLWAPRSHELAGEVNSSSLPSCAAFRNIVISAHL